MDTYQLVVDGKTAIDDIPNITVISTSSDGISPPYFSLNNRRLYLFKKLREGGYLATRSPTNTIYARIKQGADSKREREKYTLERCSETARIMGPTEKTDLVSEDIEEGIDEKHKEKVTEEERDVEAIRNVDDSEDASIRGSNKRRQRKG